MAYTGKPTHTLIVQSTPRGTGGHPLADLPAYLAPAPARVGVRLNRRGYWVQCPNGRTGAAWSAQTGRSLSPAHYYDADLSTLRPIGAATPPPPPLRPIAPQAAENLK